MRSDATWTCGKRRTCTDGRVGWRRSIWMTTATGARRWTISACWYASYYCNGREERVMGNQGLFNDPPRHGGQQGGGQPQKLPDRYLENGYFQDGYLREELIT